MGDVDPELLRAELRDALQVLEPGKLSGIVKIPSGYAILKVSQHAGTMGTHVVNPARTAAVRASGSVIFLPEVSGLDEATAAMPQLIKREDWGQDLRAVCDTHNQSYSAVMDWASQLLDPASEKSVRRNPNAKPLDLVQAYVAKGQLYAYQGNIN